jgi:pimeloyl-ACP methyl ester carboxylesterase
VAAFALHLFRTPRRRPAKPWEAGVEASGQRHYSPSGLSYLAWELPTPRLRAVALHGWEGRSTQWGPLALLLNSAGIEVIALDAPGHGKTDGSQADPLIFAKSLEVAVAELGPFDIGMGHSMGGGSLTLALSRGLPLKRAVIIASPASFADSILAFTHFIGLSKRSLAHFVAGIEKLSGMSMEHADLSRSAVSITAAGLIVHDHDDPEIPFASAARLAELWPGAKSLESRGLGHRALLRDPVVMEGIRDFLTQPAN